MIENTGQDPTAFWEELYAQRDRIWSGSANQALVDVAAGLAPGRALDLGSGEGGDSLWLAGRGWRVDGVDISATALARAAEHARERQADAEAAAAAIEGAGAGTAGPPAFAADRIRWIQADLAEWRPDGEYDLVSACFLHSPVEFPREAVLRRAASAVAPGGALLVVGHAAFPPWSHVADHDRPALPSADEVLTSLELPEGEWRVLVCENRSREATGPDGQRAPIDDAVLLVERLAR